MRILNITLQITGLEIQKQTFIKLYYLITKKWGAEVNTEVSRKPNNKTDYKGKKNEC